MSPTGKRILIVEDQRLIAADLESTLKKLGYEIAASVAAGEDAVRRASELAPDLILMDIRLRGDMDGILAAQAIRQRTDVPIVYLTAYADDETLIRARETSPFGYLVKPFNERELRAAIEIAISKHESDRLLFEERAKRRAAEEFKLLVNGVLDCSIIMLDPEGRVASWNEGARRIKGYTAEEVLGKHFAIFYPQDEVDAGIPQAVLEATLRDGRMEREGWRVRRDGSMFWANVAVSVIRDDSGRLHGFGKVTRDLTERRRAELALSDRVAHTSAMIGSALDCIISMDASGRIVEFNPAAEVTFGYPREDAIGQDMASLIIPERLRSRHRAALATYLETGQGPILGQRIELPGLRKDGTEITCELTIVRLPGTTPPLFTGFLRDVTEQRASEARRDFLDRATLALASSLDLSTTLQQAARVAVPDMADWCLVDAVGDDTRLTQVAAAHVDPSKQDLARQLARSLALQPGLGHGAMHVFLTGKPELHPEITDVKWAAKLLGTEYPELVRQLGVYSFICVPIRFRGRTFGVVSLLRASPPRRYTAVDLEFAEELAQRLAMAIDNARLYAQAQEAIRARDEFLQIASHELKTPLTPLQLQLDILARALAKAGLQNEVLTDKLMMATRQAVRLNRLVESLLDVSRITAGRIVLELEAFDLSDLVRDLVARFGAEARAAGSELTMQADDQIRGRWDRLRIEQTITNLLANAIKYGQGKPIEVDVHATDGFARLSVTDHGIGIDKDALGRIFGRFERAVSLRHFGGLGLGLFIARQFAEAHGGSIVAHSKPGSGSTFTVVLPVESTSRLGVIAAGEETAQ
jgi:PAS domain S-box-containing protein